MNYLAVDIPEPTQMVISTSSSSASSFIVNKKKPVAVLEKWNSKSIENSPSDLHETLNTALTAIASAKADNKRSMMAKLKIIEQIRALRKFLHLPAGETIHALSKAHEELLTYAPKANPQAQENADVHSASTPIPFS